MADAILEWKCSRTDEKIRSLLEKSKSETEKIGLSVTFLTASIDVFFFLQIVHASKQIGLKPGCVCILHNGWSNRQLSSAWSLILSNSVYCRVNDFLQWLVANHCWSLDKSKFEATKRIQQSEEER